MKPPEPAQRTAIHPALHRHDWAAGPLGPPDHWPAALRVAAGLVLDAAVPMWLAWGPQLTMLYNAPYGEMLGGKHPGAMGAPLQQVWAEVWPQVEPLVATTLAGEGLHRDDLPLLVNRRGLLEPAWFTFSYTPLRDDAGAVQGLLCHVWDTTSRVLDQQHLDRAERALRELNDTLERRVQEALAERARTEDALRQAQKMEAVGQLTGGIAHDFNNMLAIVISALDLLGRRVTQGDARAMRYVDAARDGARRAAQLTQRLLAFARQQPLQPVALDANKLVAGMSELLRRSLGSAIRLETVLAGGLWRTHADPNQLENVILNLAVNGRDAMADSGRLTIETGNAWLDERYAAEHLGVAPGQYVLIAVSDTGSGMPPEVVAKAFDPFFTTKEVGRGTGLGLSQVYGFVKQSGGHVKIYSEPGQGTVVKVYLPRLLGPARDEAPTPALRDLPLGDPHELVLVVEDEAAVRQLAVDALTELGYRVLQANGAATALQLIDAHPDIRLLFTDVVMPEVNGRKLADAARQRRPGLKVLFTTGYTRNAVVHNGVLDPGMQLIGKPYTLDDLANRVRDLLDAGPDGETEA